MTKRKPSSKIIRGLFDAVNFAAGDKSAGKATVYRVRHLGDRVVVETKGRPPRIVRVPRAAPAGSDR